jgi:hypothetical protein
MYWIYRVLQKGLYNFTTLKAYKNLYRGHTQRFELSKYSKPHRVLPRIVIRNCFDLFFSIPSISFQSCKALFEAPCIYYHQHNKQLVVMVFTTTCFDSHESSSGYVQNILVLALLLDASEPEYVSHVELE